MPGGAGCAAGAAGDAGAMGAARRLSASARRPAAAGQLWLSASTRLLSKSDSVGQEAGDEGNTGGGGGGLLGAGTGRTGGAGAGAAASAFFIVARKEPSFGIAGAGSGQPCEDMVDDRGLARPRARP